MEGNWVITEMFGAGTNQQRIQLILLFSCCERTETQRTPVSSTAQHKLSVCARSGAGTPGDTGPAVRAGERSGQREAPAPSSPR